VGDLYVPASINSTAIGNPNSTLAVVAVPAQDFDWRPQVTGHTIITPETTPDVRVDMYARLNGETNGNIIASCPGISNVNERLHFTAAPAPGSADSFNKVIAGQSATIHMRVERQAGTKTYSTAASTTRFGVRVQPTP
jgi:hypothetical protein